MRQEGFSKCRLQISSMLLSAFNQDPPSLLLPKPEAEEANKKIRSTGARWGNTQDFFSEGTISLGDVAAFLLSGTILLLSMCQLSSQLRLSATQMDSEDSSITAAANLRMEISISSAQPNIRQSDWNQTWTSIRMSPNESVVALKEEVSQHTSKGRRDACSFR